VKVDKQLNNKANHFVPKKEFNPEKP